MFAVLKNKYSLSFSHLLTPTILLRLNAFQIDGFTKQLFLFDNKDVPSYYFSQVDVWYKRTCNFRDKEYNIDHIIHKNVFLIQLPKLTAYRKLSHKIVLYLIVGGIAQITPIKIIRFQFRGNYFPLFPSYYFAFILWDFISVFSPKTWFKRKSMVYNWLKSDRWFRGNQLFSFNDPCAITIMIRQYPKTVK